MRVLTAIAATCLTAFVTTGMAEAKEKVEVGSLECNVSGDTGFIVGSKAALTCAFKRVGGDVEKYDGSITKIGLDVGFTSDTKMVWVVLAPTSDVDPGALAGRYYGVSAEATAGVGVGANVLVGGFDSSFNLQPLSVQGQTGVDIAAGVAELHLRLAK